MTACFRSFRVKGIHFLSVFFSQFALFNFLCVKSQISLLISYLSLSWKWGFSTGDSVLSAAAGTLMIIADTLPVLTLEILPVESHVSLKFYYLFYTPHRGSSWIIPMCLLMLST